MAKAVYSLPSGLTVGVALLGRHGTGRGSVKQQVHDGDTVIVEAFGNLSVRFLGIDTPEVSFMFPGTDLFKSIHHNDWNTFLADPFASAPQGFVQGLTPGLEAHLRSAVGPGCATNHADHAEAAHRHLESLIEEDMTVLGADKDSFQFFLAFAHEVMDGYGRLLGFLNRNQENPEYPAPRPRSYNERMLEAGMSSPYFIWPNVNPFRARESLMDAVPAPGDLGSIADSTGGLGEARAWIQAARNRKIGIFDAAKPLKLEPFELRYLARLEGPSRWVIDLSTPGSTTLLKPTSYHTVAHSEDRLYVPAEYVPLFVERGWQREV